jgi:hypothetical protein
VCYLLRSIAFRHVSMNWRMFHNVHIIPHRQRHSVCSYALGKVVSVVLNNVASQQQSVCYPGIKSCVLIPYDVNTFSHYAKHLIQHYMMTSSLAHSALQKTVFRRMRLVAYSASCLRHVRPSVHPHISVRLQLYGFPWNLIWGTSVKIC